MPYLAKLDLPAQRSSLPLLSAFIRSLAEQLHLDEETAFDLEVATEEAATNIITHAYLPDQDGMMSIEAHLTHEERILLRLTDWGIPFPVGKIKPFDRHAPVEARIQGGMGLHIIQTVMDSVERVTSQHPGDPNILILSKALKKNIPQTQREKRELHVLQTIGEVMSAPIDLDDLLRIILQKLVETVEAKRGTLYLVDEQLGECYARMSQEDQTPEIRLKIGEGIAGKVAETGKALNITNAPQHPLFAGGFDVQTGFQTQSILAVPMRNPQQKIIGVVQLLNKIDGSFTPADERLLTAMASQVAIIIENARLYKQELQQKLLERELQTARDIQTSFLPDDIPHLAGWEIAADWKPVKDVAGDFYDFRVMDDGRLALIIADVSGKGIPAALFMALTVIVLRFGMSLNLSPLELILRTNKGIIQHQRSRMFATMFIAYLDPLTGAVDCISAGHNPPLHYHAGKVKTIHAKGTAVGVFSQAQYTPKTFTLDVGDILVLYTDGLTEIINAEEEEFGEERLAKLLKKHAGRSAADLVSILTEAAHKFAGEQSRFDDETILILKRLA